jgi:hypothetical protein
MNWLRRLFGRRAPATEPVTPPEVATLPEGIPPPPEPIEGVREERDDWENEGGAVQEPREKSDRDTFFSNQEQVGRPTDQTNGQKARESGSNPDPSI